MADEKKRIIQLPALDLADVPVGAFFPVDSATDEQDPNTGAHKVAVSDVVDAIENAIATSEQAEQAVQDLADDVETLSEECARNDIIATPYIEDGSVHGYRVNAIVTHANKLYQNQTGGNLMQIDFNPSVWTEITVGDYINKLCEDFAEEWISSQSYDVGDIVIQAGQLYRCKRATSASSISSLDWDEITVTDLLSESGRVQDVYVNGTSVVDLNKIAQIKSYKEVTQAEYDALPSSKLTDNILYCIKDGGVAIVNDVRRNGTSIVSNGVADIAVDTNPTQHSTNLVTSGGVYNAITPMQQQLGWLAYSIEAEWYNGSNTYNVGDYVWQNGSNSEIGLFKCIATTTGSWDSSKWEPVTVTSELETKADKTYVDESIDKQLVHGTASGEIASFSDGEDLPMPSLKVGIEPIQEGSGEPSPTNIRPISGHTEANVSVSGKNMFYMTNDNKFLGYLDNTKIVANANHTCYYFPCKANVTYTVSKTATATNGRLGIAYSYEVPSNNLPIYGVQTKSSGFVVGQRAYLTTTTDASAKYIIVWAYWGDDEDSKSTIQLEFGSEPTTFTPYDTNSQTYNIQFKDGDNPLTVYGGTLDVVSGVLTVDRVELDLGSRTYNKSSDGYFYCFTTDLNFVSFDKDNPNAECEIYKLCTYAEYTSKTVDSAIFGNNNSHVIYIADSRFTDVNDLKTALNGVKLIYELVTPLTIQLTPTQVKSLLGSNNVWADCGEILEANYIRCLDITINDLISRIEALEG